MAIEQNHRKFHVRVFRKDIVGFAEHQEKAAFGLGYKLTLKRIIDNTILSRNAATDDGKTQCKNSWYIPQFTPSIIQNDFLSYQFLIK